MSASMRTSSRVVLSAVEILWCSSKNGRIGLRCAASLYRTADRLKTRIEIMVSAAANTATTSKLSDAIAVVSCSFQMLCSPVLSPSSP